jgi:hypothetical protein
MKNFLKEAYARHPRAGKIIGYIFIYIIALALGGAARPK